jgi:hypothetical protein
VFRRTTETAHLRLHHDHYELRDDHDYDDCDHDHALQILLIIRIPALVHLSSHHRMAYICHHDEHYDDHDYELQILLILYIGYPSYHHELYDDYDDCDYEHCDHQKNPVQLATFVPSY